MGPGARRLNNTVTSAESIPQQDGHCLAATCCRCSLITPSQSGRIASRTCARHMLICSQSLKLSHYLIYNITLFIVKLQMDVISLAIQLVTTVRQISEFVRCVRGAPSEVVKLAESLDQLQNSLDHARLLVDQQSTHPDLPNSIEALTSALEYCKTKLRGLQDLVDKIKAYLTAQHRALRTWGALKIILGKGEIQEAQSQIRDATTNLHSAIVINSAIAATMSIHEY